MRLLILIGSAYILYRGLKSWAIRFIASHQNLNGQNEIEDIMVQDPVCKVYFPKRDACPLNVNGETIYFCSMECRDKYDTT